MTHLLCSVVILPDELARYAEALAVSLSRWREVAGVHVRLYVQGGSAVALPDTLAAQLDSVSFRPDANLSAARNESIVWAESAGCDWIYFHDASVVCRDSVLAWVAQSDACQSVILRAQAVFGEVPWRVPGGVLVASCPPLFPWLWTYLFRVEALKTVRFREDIGPGSGSARIAGEDALFLHDYFTETGHWRVSPVAVTIWHPVRPMDGRKHLAYAYGQGMMFRELLRRPLAGWRHWPAFLLFVLNTLLGLVRSPIGIELFRRRLRGLLLQPARDV